MVEAKKKMRLPIIVSVLLAVTFVMGVTSGAFIYATGGEVVNEVFIKMISHTEYRYAESGQIVARLVDYQGNAVTVQNCTATILYPDKTLFVEDALMTATGNISGDHYYNFTTPSGPEGIYEYQATCNYLQGATPRTSSVTNSFHLSSAFTNVLNNLTALETQLTAVNSSLAANISTIYNSLSSQMNANTTDILTELSAVNSSLSDLIADFTSGNVSVTVNFTEVTDAISALQTNMAANFTQVFSEFTVVGTNIQEINVTTQDTNTRVQGIESTLTSMTSTLNNINTTTTNTYDYVTGALTTSVDNILTSLGIINATVNRIETNTLEINTTTQTILTNQQNEVVMTVFSG